MTDIERNEAMQVVFESFFNCGKAVIGYSKRKAGAVDCLGNQIIPFRFSTVKVVDDVLAVFFDEVDGVTAILNVDSLRTFVVDERLMFINDLNDVIFFDIVRSCGGIKKSIILQKDSLKEIASNLSIRGIYPETRFGARCAVASLVIGNNTVPYNFFIGKDFGMYPLSDLITGDKQ